MAGICNLCGLPDELCICQEIAKEQQKAIISVVRRRYGKLVTIVEGIDDAAIDIGFLAPVLRERIAKVGNAAAQGAREVLLSQSKRARIEALVKRIDHIELETTPDFFELFVEGCQFKPMPSVL